MKMKTFSFKNVYQYPLFVIAIAIIAPAFPFLHEVNGGILNSVYDVTADTACKFYSECCRAPFIRNDSAAKVLHGTLKRKYFGQHIAVKAVINALHAHLSHERTNKPLVLSFHGWVGSGKTYLAELIAEALYEKGLNSQYKRVYLASLHFPPDEKRIPEFKENLQKEIKETLKLCEYALFIFEEVDNIPPKVFDSLVAFLEKLSPIEGINHKKAIYLFLCNIGSNTIIDITLKAWESGKVREDLTITDFHEAISNEVFNTPNTGMYKSHIISRSLIDHFIPFLPMERKHIIECAKVELERHGSSIDPELIASNLTYWPNELNLYSRTGCKRIDQLVKHYIAAENLRDEL